MSFTRARLALVLASSVLGTAGCTDSDASASDAIGELSLGPLVIDGDEPAPPGIVFAVYERGRSSSRLDNTTPRWLLYGDGRAITPRPDGEGRLQGRVQQPIALGRELFDLLRDEPEHRWLERVMDLPATVFLVRSDGGWIRREVEGMPLGCRPPDSAAATLIRSCALLRGLTLEDPTPWDERPPEADYLERVDSQTQRRYVVESQARSAAARRTRHR